MWTTDAGVRFELSPWRARRVIAQAKEIARRRRDGEASLPGGVLHDLQRMARFARPVKNMVHQPTGNQMRVFEAQLPDGMFRMMTQSRPGIESVLGVAFRATEGEIELEAQYGGSFSIDWMRGPPIPLGEALKRSITTEPGVYIIFRNNEKLPKYVGKADNLRKRLAKRFEYSRQHGDDGNLKVIYGKVLGKNGASPLKGVFVAEHAIIRTLDPVACISESKKCKEINEKSSSRKILTNRTSICCFKAQLGRVTIEPVLPPYLWNLFKSPNYSRLLHPAYRKAINPDDDATNKVGVAENRYYELNF